MWPFNAESNVSNILGGGVSRTTYYPTVKYQSPKERDLYDMTLR